MDLIKTRQEFPALLNGLGLVGKAAEIGVCEGEFANHLLSNWQGKKLYMIDAWRYFEGVKDFANPDPPTHLKNFDETFKRIYGYKERAVIMRELSVEAASIFPDQFFDFVYIDAAHDYANVKADLAAWYPKVKDGGVFAGHDYHDNIVYLRYYDPDGNVVSRPGEELTSVCNVKKAVNEFAGSLDKTVNSTTENCENGNMPSWWWVK